MQKYDVIIVGAGPAGIFTALEMVKRGSEKKILIVDDDVNICELIKVYFTNEGYDVQIANDGISGMQMFKSYDPDIVLLDLMLPKKDGTDVCREIRANSNKPMIMITAKGGVFDKVLGLELGADDYIVKPFDPKELVARVKAVLRRYTSVSKKGSIMEFDGLLIDHESYEVIYHGKKLDMPPKEFELLSFIASNPNRVFTRDTLLDKIWGYEYVGDTRTVDVHIKRIREKFDKEDSWNIRTVYGVGYKFEV